MKKLLALEELALTAAALYLLSLHALDLPAWAWCLLFFAPDASMLGYAWGPRAGALLYNIAHHRAVAIALGAAGCFGAQEPLLATGLLLLAHASFDRILGYGLKYAAGFKQTHLGSLEKVAKDSAAAPVSGSGLPA